MSDPIRLLAERGDPIERLMVTAWDALHQPLNPYAGIWATHIQHRRMPENPTQVQPEWMNFAGSHYTAMLRVYQAFRRFESVQLVLQQMAAGDDRAAILVGLHDDVAAFWEHIGSAIDNLSAAWTDAPVLRVEHAKEKIVASAGSRLDWMYDRRSQFIHSRIVPKGIQGGIPFFNVRLFDDKRSTWDSKNVREELVEEFYPNVWHEFLTEIGDAWECLRARLGDRDHEKFEIRSIEFSSFDAKSYGPDDVRVESGPTPPTKMLWNIPPSGTW